MLNTDMSRWELDCQIQGNEIIVSMPDTGWSVTFYKSANSPERERERRRNGRSGFFCAGMEFSKRQGARARVDRVMGSGLILAVRPKRQDCIECNPKADIHQPCERVD